MNRVVAAVIALVAGCGPSQPSPATLANSRDLVGPAALDCEHPTGKLLAGVVLAPIGGEPRTAHVIWRGPLAQGVQGLIVRFDSDRCHRDECLQALYAQCNATELVALTTAAPHMLAVRPVPDGWAKLVVLARGVYRDDDGQGTMLWRFDPVRRVYR